MRPSSTTPRPQKTSPAANAVRQFGFFSAVSTTEPWLRARSLLAVAIARKRLCGVATGVSSENRTDERCFSGALCREDETGGEHQNRDRREDEGEQISVTHTPAWRLTGKGASVASNGLLNRLRSRLPAVTERETAGGASGQPESDTNHGAGGGYAGPRLVVALYVILVGVATTAGFLTGTFVDGLEAPRFLFLIPFPATPLGFAAYGGLTIALVLGIPLALVSYVSQQLDDAA